MQRSKLELIFLICLISFTLLTVVGLGLATVFWGYGFPGTLAALLAGICVGTLSYTFLGGVDGAVFKLGGFQLAGSVAAIVIVFYLVNGPLDNSMKDVRAIAIGKDAQKQIGALEAQIATEQKLKNEAVQRANRLEAQESDERVTGDSAILKKIGESSADDALGKGVLQLYKDGKGPFDRTLQTLQLSARFNSQVASGTFRYCHDKRPELEDKPVRFEIIDASAGTSQKIELQAGADIGPGLCSAIKFDVQLGCDAVAQLLGNSAKSCDMKNGVAWTDASDNKVYDLTATILNPELMH
jgi:hypothetical protein